MLQWRAITAVARLACPEALYGVSYTPDEMYDMSAGQAPAEAAPVAAQVVEAEPDPEPMTTRTRGELFALFGQKGIGEDEQLSGVNHINGTAHESRSQITEAEALAAIRVLRKRPDVDTETGEIADAEIVETGADA
jgi:hypothetical protein